MTGRRIDHVDDPDAPRPTRIVPAVAVAVVNDADQLLMIRRADNGKWALPGGKQEVGETPMQAGRREVLEETGVRCEITGLVGIFSNPHHVVEYASDGEVRQEFAILFAGTAVGGELTTSSESLEVAWCDRRDVLRLDLTPAHRRRVRYFLEFTGAPFLE
ncbi:MAG TPA: NUDIX domain-containing protein [Pseudonocardia sp.]|uniref:NUDIX domain-containing protein n=1 Tax=Pseudonocardia sp. TaxID=60912 RepID=UPI002B4AAED3|nr:NUDIX domain-containing protein [Pseudonocardia sp.]HLU55907.1 NUDIX domain-containing protein [Pseudonocardia sp.]